MVFGIAAASDAYAAPARSTRETAAQAPPAATKAAAPAPRTATRPPLPARLTISPAVTRPAAGSLLRFGVRVTRGGKPVKGARLVLRLQVSPARDARVVRVLGRTDARGTFTAVLHLSRKVGAYLLVARWGRYSAKLRVISRPFRPAGQMTSDPVLAWVALATIGLVLLGIFVNLEVLRRVTWSLTFGRLRRRRAPGAT